MKKRGEFSFVWLFAIIAGGMILFFAIYGTLKAGNTQKDLTNTKTAKEISILTDPLQAGFASGSFGSIEFSSETRIMNDCFPPQSDFGRNEISVMVKSNVGEKWTRPGTPALIYNKYIFSNRENTGEKYYVFSKQFKFPYEVADLIFITPENYCFVQAPDNIKEEIEGMSVPNIEFVDLNACKLDNSLRVCFNPAATKCDILVTGCDYSECKEGKVLLKSGAELKYVGNLLYAAIFSDELVYTCNVKRLLYRTSKIAEILAQKANLMDARDCESNLDADLAGFSSATKNADESNLHMLQGVAENLEERNTGEACGLWE